MSLLEMPPAQTVQPRLNQPAVVDERSRADRFAARALAGPFAAGLGLLAIAQFFSWAPQYLTWPWWSDHDAFATIAHGWGIGKLPYHDLISNNFPGQIYIFYLLGRTFGWAWTPGIYLFDACLIAGLGFVSCVWSRKIWGSWIPGLIGWLAFAGYYFELDYSQTAQRDGQAAILAVIGLLTLQAFPNRLGRGFSAIALATAMVFRPQTVLFGPAYLTALASLDRGPGLGGRTIVVRLMAWASVFVLACLALFAPLAAAGVFGDFLAGIRNAGAGWRHGVVGTVLKGLFVEATLLKVWAVVCLLILLRRFSPGAGNRSPVNVWLAAFAGVMWYRPLSPIGHAYLLQPLMLVWTVLAANLAGVIVNIFLRENGSAFRLAWLTLLLAAVNPGRPIFSNPESSLKAMGALAAGTDPLTAPLGYRHNLAVIKTPPYDWLDYRSMLEYLRTQTSPSTRVANALKRMPAVTGPAGRLSVFRAESLEWLLVRPQDEELFADALDRDRDAIVVWDPEAPNRDSFFTLEKLGPVIRRRYEPAAKFGYIEVWKRKRSEE